MKIRTLGYCVQRLPRTWSSAVRSQSKTRIGLLGQNSEISKLGATGYAVRLRFESEGTVVSEQTFSNSVRNLTVVRRRVINNTSSMCLCMSESESQQRLPSYPLDGSIRIRDVSSSRDEHKGSMGIKFRRTHRRGISRVERGFDVLGAHSLRIRAVVHKASHSANCY